jgi:subtilase family serine protease
VTRVPRSTLALLSSAALIAATAGMAAAAPNQSKTTRLSGSTPAWANAAHRLGATPGSTPVDFRVYLNWRGGDAAANYAMAAATKGSAMHGHFLTPAQFRAKFAPTQSDTNAVKSWLRSQGFQVAYTPSNRKYVEATGTVRQASKSFSTSFSQYSVHGKHLRSNSTALRVPSSLHGVQAVLGLDQSEALVHTDGPPPGAFVNARPCSTYWGEKTVESDPPAPSTLPAGVSKLPANPPDWAPCGYAGSQLQGAYGMSSAIASGNNGNGVTVAIIDAYASPDVRQDLEHYSSLHGLPAIGDGWTYREMAAPGTYRRPNNPQHSPSGWSGEETLDVEAVHTMAPQADILYVGSPNNRQDMDAAMNKIVNGHLADIVTNSYGFSSEAVPPGYRKPFNDILMQASAEGISVFFSSGDFGDETLGDPSATPTPDWPASSPWVTAVGGTSLGVGATDQRLFELGWETGKETLQSDGTWSAPFYTSGSGGGTSRIFPQPSYQRGVVPSEISQTYGGPAMRTVPDVAALGDPTTGMLVGQTQVFPDGVHYGEYRIGGTSLSSPLYAGMFALAIQKSGHAFGLANPALYATYSGQTTNDILPVGQGDPVGAVRADYANTVDASNGYLYSVRLFDFDSVLTIHVRPGYDDVTGIGSPKGTDWVSALAKYGR